ncbi:MAG: methyltransferase domain-containing protein [Candidatus Heimdallarchaeota archaeon]|nr:methyltransferase domain-containing protein [Candidatus Heimdallarchaeota archaeon]
MRLFRKLRTYMKMVFLYLTKRIVRREDYREEYNIAASTYHIWLKKMNKHTNTILKIDHLKNQENIHILDFACGTGYISGFVLSALKDPTVKITAVDISDKMIEIAKGNISDSRCSFIVRDGTDFLFGEEDEKYDAIFCGYALPYFNHKKVIKEFHRILKKNGTAHFITNCKGTLKGIDEIYIDTMKEYSSSLNKIMEIGYQLPKNQNDLKSWFERRQFSTVFLDTVEEIISYSSPEELYNWLKNTGAIAGTDHIFSDEKEIIESIINKIENRCNCEDKYCTNHKFIQGIFKKK